MTIDSKVSIPDTVFLQEVDDEMILLDTDTQEYFSLNEVGGVFYQAMKHETNFLKLIEMLSEHFEVEQNKIEKDFTVFINSLEEKGLLKIK